MITFKTIFTAWIKITIPWIKITISWMKIMKSWIFFHEFVNKIHEYLIFISLLQPSSLPHHLWSRSLSNYHQNLWAYYSQEHLKLTPPPPPSSYSTPRWHRLLISWYDWLHNHTLLTGSSSQITDHSRRQGTARHRQIGHDSCVQNRFITIEMDRP